MSALTNVTAQDLAGIPQWIFDDVKSRLDNPKNEVMFANLPFESGDAVVVFGKQGSLIAPYCKYCWNSFAINVYDDSNDESIRVAICNKCNVHYPFQYV